MTSRTKPPKDPEVLKVRVRLWFELLLHYAAGSSKAELLRLFDPESPKVGGTHDLIKGWAAGSHRPQRHNLYLMEAVLPGSHWFLEFWLWDAIERQPTYTPGMFARYRDAVPPALTDQIEQGDAPTLPLGHLADVLANQASSWGSCVFYLELLGAHLLRFDSCVLAGDAMSSLSALRGARHSLNGLLSHPTISIVAEDIYQLFKQRFPLDVLVARYCARVADRTGVKHEMMESGWRYISCARSCASLDLEFDAAGKRYFEEYPLIFSA